MSEEEITPPEANDSEPILDTEQSPEQHAVYTPPQRINRIGIGSVTVIMLILAFGCVVMINYLVSSTHLRQDLTERSDFTLSPKTLQYIQGDTFSKRETPVKITAILDPEAQYYFNVKSTLEEYALQSDGKIELSFINKTLDENKRAEVASTYKRNLYQEMLLIDARPDEIDPKDKADPLVKYVREIPVTELYKEDLDSSNQKFISAWQTEDKITNHLISAVEGKPRVFYLLVDKSKVDAKSKDFPAWKAYEAYTRSQNVQLVPLSLSSVTKIPDDANGVAIIGAQSDFGKDEIKVLEEYWARLGASIFITIDPNVKLTKLEHFLRDWGIDRRPNKVVTVRNGDVDSNAKVTFVKGHPTTTGLGNLSTQLDGLSSSMRINNDKENIGVNTQPLLLAAAGWWGETGAISNPKFNTGEEGSEPTSASHPPLYLAASVVRGKGGNSEKDQYTGRMMVVGNTDFIKPKNRRAELSQFLDSSINWLARREDLINIGPKKTYFQKITIDEKQKGTFDWITLVFLPLGSIIIAFVFWNTRRS